MPQGFPGIPSRDWIWLSRSCTCRGLVMYLSCTPYSRATENLQDECLTLMWFMSAVGLEPIADIGVPSVEFAIGVSRAKTLSMV